MSCHKLKTDQETVQLDGEFTAGNMLLLLTSPLSCQCLSDALIHEWIQAILEIKSSWPAGIGNLPKKQGKLAHLKLQTAIKAGQVSVLTCLANDSGFLYSRSLQRQVGRKRFPGGSFHSLGRKCTLREAATSSVWCWACFGFAYPYFRY